MTTPACPSHWTLERHLLDELPGEPGDVAAHVTHCPACRARIAAHQAEDASFLRSAGARKIRRALGAKPSHWRQWGAAGLVAAALLLLVFGRQAAPPSASQASGANEAEQQVVLRFQQEWLEAVRTKDATALERILADDYLYTDAFGGRSNKADDLRRARTPGDGLTRFKTANVQARVYGDVAVLTGELLMEAFHQGKPFGTEVVFTDTLARIDGRWRAVAAHVSKSPRASKP